MSYKENLDPEETRTDKQAAQYLQIQKDGVCPFCRENFEKYHESEILKENENWLVTKNDNPYDGTKHHFLFVFTTRHVKSLSEISPDESNKLFELFTWVITKFEIDSGAVLIRFGEEGNGSSVRHIHAHLIVGKSKEKTESKIKVKVGYY
jgi:ATP adenylyltransferase